MRFWKKYSSALCIFAASCASAPDAADFSVRSATIERDVLVAQLDWQPSSVLLDALDHGIALTFVITLRGRAAGRFGWMHNVAQARWHRELHFFPLTRQYQLRDADRDDAARADTRTFAARASLIAGMANLQLQLPAEWLAARNNAKNIQSYTLHVALERDHLPGALRLPAVIDADWHLSTGTYTWPVPPNSG